MAELTNTAILSSSLYSASVAQTPADDSKYVYSMSPSIPPRHIEKWIRSTINGATFGSSSSVSLATFGILKSLILKVKVKWTAHASANACPVFSRSAGINMIRKISLQNSSREVCAMFPEAMQHQLYNMPYAERQKWKLASLDNVRLLQSGGAGAGVAKGTAGASYTADFYVPIFLPFMREGGSGHEYSNLLNLRFAEVLQLNIDWAESWKVIGVSTAGAFVAPPTIESCEVLQEFHILSQKALNQLEQKQYNLSTPLSQLIRNYTRDADTYTSTSAGVLDAKMQLFNTSLAHSMLITLRRKPDVANVNAIGTFIDSATSDPNNVYADTTNKISRYGADFHEIDEIYLRSGGRIIWESRSVEEGNFLADLNSGGQLFHDCAEAGFMYEKDVGYNDANGNSAVNFYVINFADDQKVSNSIEGCLAQKSLNNLTLEIKATGCGNAKEWELVCTTINYQIVSTESASGRLQISLST